MNSALGPIWNSRSRVGLSYNLNLKSSLYLFQDARSCPDKLHDAWMSLGLALAGAWPGLGLALAGPWPGPWMAPGWPLAGPWPGPGLWLPLGDQDDDLSRQDDRVG